MAKLLYFYPENDLALARDVARYTAPPAGVRLRNAGVTLPLWYGNAGDQVMCRGVNAAWWQNLRDCLGLAADVYRHDPAGLEPAPWGWSKASRQAFLSEGLAPAALPDDAALDYIRALSHRRTACAVSRRLAEALPFAVSPVPTEATSFRDVVRAVTEAGDALLKLPWSGSGRGLVATDASMIASQADMVEGMLKRQGAVMVEKRLRKKLDFAMLFTMAEGRCRFDGYSVFQTERLGSYTGNVLATQEALEDMIAHACDAGQLRAVREALMPVLEEIAAGYNGPLGVDMMAVEDAAYTLDPCVEINFRMTMGHLSRIVYHHYIAPGAKGTYTIVPGQLTKADEAYIHDGRLSGGRIDMAQPGSDFSFIISLD